MYRLFMLLILCIAFQFSCKKQAAIPTTPSVNIDSLVLNQYDNVHPYASLQNITSADVLERGICWSMHSMPAKSDSILKMAPGQSFDTTILGIGQNTTLYFRAYVQTPTGIIWSKEVSLSTKGVKNLWQKQYYGSVRDFQQAIRIDDKSFVVMIKMYGNAIAWTELVKLDTAGNVLWDHEYNQFEWKEPESLIKVKDGYLFATTAYVAGGKQSAVVKIDNDGNKLWEKGFNKLGWQEYVRLFARSDTSFTFTTRTFDGIVLGKRQNCQLVDYTFNKNGDLLTQQATPIANKFAEGSYAIKTINTPDNGFLSTTYYAPPSDYFIPHDILLQKFVNNLFIWEKLYGGSGDEYSVAIQRAVDNNYTILGYTNSKGTTDQSAWLFGTNLLNGDLLWEGIYSNTTFGSHTATFPLGLHVNSIGEYYITGTASDKGYSTTAAFLAKMDAHGKYLWAINVEDKGGYKYTRANAAFTDPDGTIYVFGTKISDMSSFANLLFMSKLKE